MSFPVRIFRWLIAHLVIAIVGVVVILGLILVVAPGGKDNPGSLPATGIQPGTTPGSPGPEVVVPQGNPNEDPANPQAKPGDKARMRPLPDPFDSDPKIQAEIEKQMIEQPAMQFIPLDEAGVFGDLTNVLPDGRLLITVTYSGSQAAAQKTWLTFLKRYKDTGQNYVVVYEKK